MKQLLQKLFEKIDKFQKEKSFVALLIKQKMLVLSPIYVVLDFFFGLKIFNVMKKEKMIFSVTCDSILQVSKKFFSKNFVILIDFYFQMYLLFRGLEKKMNKSMYVCNCLFDTDLVSLQMNDTFTNFLRRCKSSLDGIRSGFWFYKKK